MALFLLLQLLYLVISIHSFSDFFHKSKHLCHKTSGSFYHRQLSLSLSNPSTSEFHLEQSIYVKEFIATFRNSTNIQGVFAIEDANKNVLIVESSPDIANEVQRIITQYGEEKIHSIRIQSFRSQDDSIVEAFKNELIRQSNPSILDYKSETKKAVQSPFQNNSTTKVASVVEYDPSPSPVVELDLTVSNVDRVLDEVRPYLIADGGNVAVVSVDSASRSITLSLQGACGSCQSSTTTMKMGIERVLKENFRSLGEIVAVNGVAVTSDSIPLLTEAEVNEVLSKVLPAVKAMKGSVKVREVDGQTGIVIIQFAGPSRLKKGLELVLKDNSLVKEVVFEDLIE